MEKKKKTWTEPKLTALVRRKPEEGILLACKGDNIAVSFNDKHDRCEKTGNCGTACNAIATT